MEIENTLSEIEILFLALADKTRLRLLNLMRDGEVCVNNLTEVLGESQPKISRHLAYLRTAEVVSARRAGKWINYKIILPENRFAAELLKNTLRWLEAQAAMREDYAKLMKIYEFNKDFKAMSPPASNIFVQTNTKISDDDREDLPVFLL